MANSALYMRIANSKATEGWVGQRTEFRGQEQGHSCGGDLQYTGTYTPSARPRSAQPDTRGGPFWPTGRRQAL